MSSKISVSGSFQGRFANVTCVNYEVDNVNYALNYKNAKISGYCEFMNLSREAAAILIVCEAEERILLLKQFRYPVYHRENKFKDRHDGFIYEIIAGILDNGDPLETAIQESREEAGIEINKKDIEHIYKFYSSPGISTEIIHLYLGKVEKSSKFDTDKSFGISHEGENIFPEWLSYEEAKYLMENGKIVDAKTLVALNWYFASVRQQGI